ncbi:MAG: hypothetical protein RLP45_01205, partial [Haliea sp.]
MTFTHNYIALAVTLAGSGVMAAGAVGQTPPGESLVLEQVVVTARKRDENLQDIPVAIKAFTGEDLRKQ